MKLQVKLRACRLKSLPGLIFSGCPTDHSFRWFSNQIKNANVIEVKEEALTKTLARIGAKLTYLRKKKGYSSHEDFAYDFELPRVQYWRIEKGKANITIKSLCRLLAIHDLSVEKFFFEMYQEYKDQQGGDFPDAQASSV